MFGDKIEAYCWEKHKYVQGKYEEGIIWSVFDYIASLLDKFSYLNGRIQVALHYYMLP